MTLFNLTTYKINSVPIGQFYDWVQGDNAPPGGLYYHYTDYRKGQMWSTNHKRSRDGIYREGGPWLMDRRTYSCYGSKQTTWRNGVGRAYVGAYVVSDTNDINWDVAANLGLPLESSVEDHWAETQSYGAQAYQALKPDEPDFSPVNALYELREVPGMLRIRLREIVQRMAKHRNYRYMNAAGKFHLAIQFGWKPLLRDIRSFSESFRKADKRFQQLLRDEGRGVRRRRNLSKQGQDAGDKFYVSTNTYNDPWHPAMHPTHVTQCYGGAGANTVRSDWVGTKVWCAGKARYYLPSGKRDDKWNKALMNRIGGYYVTPSTLYNAIPWSWLADYFSSTGYFVAAISQGIADRLVFEYAYVMRTQEAGLHQVCSQGIRISKSGNTGRATVVRQLIRSRKTRLTASPFGFGLSEEDLSPRQAGILSALALSMT